MTAPKIKLPAGLSIRTYEPRDQATVWELHMEGIAEMTPGGARPAGPQDEDLTRIEEEYLGAGSHFWVVEGADGLVAMAALKRVDESTARLKRMRVTAHWRRKGVAQALLDTVVEFCCRQGYARIVLDTVSTQTAAQQLYKRDGFTRTGERMLGSFRIIDYERHLTEREA
jgi:GNAT superfamily N-acetyltransferase